MLQKGALVAVKLLKRVLQEEHSSELLEPAFDRLAYFFLFAQLVICECQVLLLEALASLDDLVLLVIDDFLLFLNPMWN